MCTSLKSFSPIPFNRDLCELLCKAKIDDLMSHVSHSPGVGTWDSQNQEGGKLGPFFCVDLEIGGQRGREEGGR